MTIARNPFKLRASEQATNEHDFLALFGARIVDILPRDELWNRLIILASAPGAGKTTLLRLFSPEVLRLIAEQRNLREHQELARKLDELGALSSERPNVMGMLINCREQYASIQDLPFDEKTRLRWFFALLDARIALSTLRSAITLAGGVYPDDAPLVQLVPRERIVDAPTSGDEIYAQARATEQEICLALDSLQGPRAMSTTGKIQLSILRVLSSATLLVDGRSVADRALVMFDDAHALSVDQRRILREDLEDRQLRVARWVALRYQAFEPTELLPTARTEGRDYRELRLESWASGSGFERVVQEIADRRSRSAELPFDSFASSLSGAVSHPRDQDRVGRLLDRVRQRVTLAASPSSRFDDWISRTNQSESGSALEQAGRWRLLEILIARDRGHPQLPLDIPLPTEEMTRREDSSALAAAALFLAKEEGIPYYYGVKTVTLLSSSNIEQFLDLAGELFEKLLAVAAASLTKRRYLTAVEQDATIRTISQRRLNSLERDVPYGADVLTLVNHIGELAKTETYRSSAPYSPGVTGIALEMSDLRQLLDNENDMLPRLRRALTSALAHNIFDARPDVKVKGREWLVLYLNRLFCPVFDLPLQYGGFRERKLDQIAGWLAEDQLPLARLTGVQ